MFILLSIYRKPTRLGPDFSIGPIHDVLVDDVPKCSNSMEQAERGKCFNSMEQRREYILSFEQDSSQYIRLDYPFSTLAGVSLCLYNMGLTGRRSS
jgi:hypothetical protein